MHQVAHRSFISSGYKYRRSKECLVWVCLRKVSTFILLQAEATYEKLGGLAQHNRIIVAQSAYQAADQ